MKARALALALVALAACSSPEQERVRGEAGADVGNRGQPVVMHEGSKPYENTPRLIGADASPVDGATQARQLSLAR